MKDGVYQKELSTFLPLNLMSRRSKKTKYLKLPSLNMLKQYLDYNPDTGVFTCIKSRSNKVKVGDVIGNLEPSGYVRISFFGKDYYAHRIAWLFHHGVDPGDKLIDHKNGNRSDNKISNLRLATNQQNLWNQRPKGYVKEGKKFRARIRFKGKWLVLGLFDCPLLAHLCHMDKKKELCGEWCPS